jgi:signal transduction histidine kinase
MTGAYAYTPEIWLPLGAAAFVAALGIYAWRRRNVPAGKPFIAISLFATLMLLGIALEAAAVAPATKIAWYKFQFLMQMLAVTGGTCFTLEYVYPGRWLTRRNLTLLALPPVLTLLLIVIDDSQFVWRRLAVGPDGSVIPFYAIPGAILLAYAWCLVLLNATAFLWLFIRSPQHRWPTALMLFGQVAGRVLFLFDLSPLPFPALLDATVFAILAPWTMYAIALFGVHILDPLPAARATAIEQMRDGMVVVDSAWRVASLNPAAAKILNTSANRARGKLLAKLLPAFADLSARLADAPARTTGPTTGPIEIDLDTKPEARCYALELSPLNDFRGPIIGHLLLLHDITQQRRAQAEILEQQRTLSVLQERERLAHELHDGVAQALAAAYLQASTAKLLLARGETAQVDKCLASLADATLEAQADVREYLLGAQIVISGDHRFFPALREYVARFTQQSGLPVELAVPPQLEKQGLAQAVEVQLLRIIQEALSNVRKHAYAPQAHARRAQVILSLAGPQARIAIVDEGRGFDPAAAASQGEGYGLRAMRERAEAVGGSLAVISSPGQGTQVVVLMPLKG